MEKLEHPLWIVEWVNALLGPLVAAALRPLGFDLHGPEIIPNYLVMIMLIVTAITVMCLIMRPRLSVENPGKFQILLEDAVLAVQGLLVEWIGPDGTQFLPLIMTFGLFILLCNYAGLVPGLMSPTSNINVTLGLAITTWVYYHLQGLKKQGVITIVDFQRTVSAAPHSRRPARLPQRRRDDSTADHRAADTATRRHPPSDRPRHTPHARRARATQHRSTSRTARSSRIAWRRSTGSCRS